MGTETFGTGNYPESKVKRVLVFAAYFYPHVGGHEKYAYELSIRLVRRGYKVDILTCNTEKAPTYEELDGMEVYRIPSWDILGGNYPIPKPAPTTFKSLLKLLRRNHIVITTHTRFFLSSLLGLIFARIKGVPLVHTEHGAAHSVLSNKVLDIISKSYDHTVGSLIIKLAWKNIGVSNAACNFLKHLGATKTSIIPDGVDTQTFRKKKTKLREELGLDNAITITFVGRLIYAKGVQDLILALQEVKQKFDRVKLLIVGYGSYRQELERLARERCKEDILFLGKKSEQEIVDILNITDIFISPSYSESFGITLLQASAIGIPIIATELEATKELITDYETGLLAPPKDYRTLGQKICQLVENKDLREKLANNAHRMSLERFDWDGIADRWIREIGSQLNEVLKKKICLVSIDVEEDFTADGQKRFLGVENLDEILKVFDRFGIRATLFITGEVLENYANLVRKWSEKHEIGCHGYYHIPLSELPIPKRERQIVDFCHLYRETLGKKPQGFRAVENTIDDEQIRLLEKFGFVYDSSVIPRYPYFLEYIGYQGRAPVEPYQPSYDNCRKSGGAKIIEIPLTPLILGIPLQGTWLRMFGARFYETLLMLKKPRVVALSMHSWDCIEYKGKYAKNSGENFLKLLERLLKALDRHYVFSSCSELIEIGNSHG